MSRIGLWLALIAIVALALALRLWSLGCGLPEWYHPDEPWKARIVVRMAHGELEPEYFYHPSFMLYASATTLRVLHAFGAPLDEVNAAWAGRTMVAVLGTATVLLTFFAGRQAGGALT